MFKLLRFSIFAFLLIFINLNEIKAADSTKELYGFYIGQTLSEILKNSVNQGYTNIEIYINRDKAENEILRNKIASEFPSISKIQIINLYKKIDSGIIFFQPFYLKTINKNEIRYIKDINTAQDIQMSLTRSKYNDFKHDLISITLYPNDDQGKPTIFISVMGKYGDINNIMGEQSVLIRFKYPYLNQTITESVINILKQRFGEFKAFDVLNEKYIYSYKDGILIQAGSLKDNRLEEIEMVALDPLITYTKYYIDLKNELNKIKESKSKSLEGI